MVTSGNCKSDHKDEFEGILSITDFNIGNAQLTTIRLVTFEVTALKK